MRLLHFIDRQIFHSSVHQERHILEEYLQVYQPREIVVAEDVDFQVPRDQ